AANLGLKDNQNSGKPTAGRYVPPHLRNREQSQQQPAQQQRSQRYNENNNNDQNSNESDELVPPLQSRRSNGWHQRNE
ncbi:103_t:CDS:1, partial [Acaulospora morrowiae]